MVREPTDIIRFSRRGRVEDRPVLPSDAFRLPPGWDSYALEADWLAYWAASGRAPFKSPRRAFIGYVIARMKE